MGYFFLMLVVGAAVVAFKVSRKPVTAKTSVVPDSGPRTMSRPKRVHQPIGAGSPVILFFGDHWVTGDVVRVKGPATVNPGRARALVQFVHIGVIRMVRRRLNQLRPA